MPILPNRVIEIHDSTLVEISQSNDETVLYFSSVYIHESEGVPGQDAGTGWSQRAILRLTDSRIVGAFSEFPVRLSNGRILLGERATANGIPVPLRYEGTCELRLEAFRQAHEIVTIEGKGIELELVGEGKYLEEFRP